MKEATINQRLTQLGLTERQAKIYLVLISSGDMRIRDLVYSTQIARSTIYEDIEHLRRNGLVEEVMEEKHKIIRAYPLSSMKHKLQEEIQTLKQSVNQIDEVEAAIQKMSNPSDSPPVSVRYYKGQSGARQLLWNTLKANQDVYVYSEWGRGAYVGIDYYRKFVAESHDRNIREKVITLNIDRVLKSIREHTGSPISRTKHDDIRCVPSELIDIQGETFIYNNIYAQIFLKDNVISGFEIESEKYVDMQRSIFENQWTVASPVSTLL